MSLPASGVDPEVYRLLSAFEYIQVMTLGILAWEIIVTLDKEITLYRTHGTNKTLLLLSFSRYYTLLCLILDVTFNLVNNPTPEFCHRIRWVLPFLSTTIQFAAIPLLLLRTWAIWRRNAIITALLLALWILPLIIGTYVSTTYEGVPYALFLGLDVVGGCGNDPTNNWGTVPFILNLVVDSLIFLLTLSHLLFFQKHAIGITSLRRVIIRDGMVYYAAMVVVNVINIVFFLAPGLPPLARPLIATPATIMPAILVGRLYFNLTGNFLPGGESAGSREGDRSTVLESQPAYSFGPSTRASRQISERSDLYPLRPMDVKYGSDASETHGGY